jgi:hypothetical protein
VEVESGLMAKKITELTAATTPLAGTELAWVEQGGLPRKVAVSEFGGGGGDLSTPHDIIGDINLTSGTNGPVAAAFTDQLRFVDNDETDVAAMIGFEAANQGELIVENLTEVSDMIFRIHDFNGAGTPIRLMRLHKGNSATSGEEGYAMFNRVICNYLGSQSSSPDDPPLMVTNSGGDEDGQTQSNLSMWYNSIQAYTASAAAGSTLSINPSGGVVNIGNQSGAGTSSDVIISQGTAWHLRTKATGMNLSWGTSTLPSGGTVPNDAYYSVTTSGQSHVASMGARASDNSMVLTHDIHGAPWIIEGQNEVGNPRKIATFDTTQATSGVYIGEVNQQSALWIWEEASALSAQAAWGQIWVKSDTPNTLWFRDDAGTDFQLGAVSIPITLADNEQIQFGTGQDVTMDWDGVDFEVEGGASNQTINFRDGFHLRLWDSSDTDWLDIHNDGANIVLTELGLGEITFPAAGTLGLNMVDNTLERPILKDYSIESNTQNVSGTTATLTYANGPVFQCDMEAATGNVTITLSGGPPAGTHGQITVEVTQDTTVRTLAWAGGTFRWAGGTAHPVTTTANGFTIYTFETWDGGTTWYGAGADYS